MTPDPIDALKYALTIVATRLDGQPGYEDVIAAVETAAAPFTDGRLLDDLRYSDGRAVTATTEYEPGRAFMTHFLPPGYPPSGRGFTA